MMMGAGILPGPFARADERGLDEVLAALEGAESEWGEHFAPPSILRRLVAQGRLGKKTGQGFFPYPQPDEGQTRETVLLETRDDIGIVWLNRPPTNPLSPQVVRELLGNLVSNAVKHSPRGDTVSLVARGDGDFIRFDVSDNGSGIPAHEQARIALARQQPLEPGKHR